MSDQLFTSPEAKAAIARVCGLGRPGDRDADANDVIVILAAREIIEPAGKGWQWTGDGWLLVLDD